MEYEGHWGQKPNTMPLSRVDSLAPDVMNDISPSPLTGPSQTASRHNSQPENVFSGVSPRPRSGEFSDNDNSDQDSSNMQLGSQYRSTRRTRGGMAGVSGGPQTRKSGSATMGPNLTEKLLEAQSAQREQLLDKRLQHEREIHTTTLDRKLHMHAKCMPLLFLANKRVLKHSFG